MYNCRYMMRRSFMLNGDLVQLEVGATNMSAMARHHYFYATYSNGSGSGQNSLTFEITPDLQAEVASRFPSQSLESRLLDIFEAHAGEVVTDAPWDGPAIDLRTLLLAD